MNSRLVMQARDEIDALDEQLSGLLLRRRKLSAAVIRERMCQGRPMRDLSREHEIRRAAVNRADSPAAAQFLDAIFQCVLAEAPTPQKLWQLAAQTGGCVKIGAASFGAGTFELIAGPCAVEDEEQLMAAARAACDAGARVLRGGAFKPRTSPHSFQGLGLQALPMLRAAADTLEMAVITEVLDPGLVPMVADHVDALQIGARSMQNTPLLQEAGRSGLPVVIKRGLCASVDELLHAVDYVLGAGGRDVIVCLRGLRTMSDASRFTLDLAAINYIKSRVSTPVIVDPSHAAGRRELVTPLALAAVAAGADGLMVEVHADPSKARCDGPQALLPEDLLQLATTARAVVRAVTDRCEAPYESLEETPGWPAAAIACPNLP